MRTLILNKHAAKKAVTTGYLLLVTLATKAKSCKATGASPVLLPVLFFFFLSPHLLFNPVSPSLSF